MALDAAFAKKLLDYKNGLGTPAAITGPIRCRLMVTNGTPLANGTEVATGGGYTSAAGAPSVTLGAATTANPSAWASSTAISVASYPRVETINGVELWTSDATPLRTEQGALSSAKVMAIGDTFSIPIASLSGSLI